MLALARCRARAPTAAARRPHSTEEYCGGIAATAPASDGALALAAASAGHACRQYQAAHHFQELRGGSSLTGHMGSACAGRPGGARALPSWST